ncbi:isocyanide synthase family protein [Crossiella sp. SN42]|uniref:L-tyrosine/L-tryptophan isonitrile synthase family protein n=1 Tax=Crossiella sp. SN42 TaxID=2944808 RepID=UPI00207CED1F|nr:L-tyrosine/L-tryptophan isonitrile synthase family protein [Crossiella sp. SN42]MCO1575466.1 isocyanide synthase family protein [Crossiella sp. SN42]
MSEETRRVAESVMELVLAHQRKLGGPVGCRAPRCERCLSAHLGQVERSVEAGSPVVFVLPAFPGKSPNEAKVLGTVPDLGDRVMLMKRAEAEAAGAELVSGDGRLSYFALPWSRAEVA